MNPGDMVLIVRVAQTSRGLVGYDQDGHPFLFAGTHSLEKHRLALGSRIALAGWAECVVINEKQGRARVVSSLAQGQLLVEAFYDQGTIRVKRRKLLNERWQRVAARYGNIVRVIPLKKASFALLAFRDDREAWVLPCSEDRLYKTLPRAQFPLRVCPPPALEWTSVYRSDDSLPRCFKADLKLFVPGGKEGQTRPCTVFLHGFLKGQSAHRHVCKHVLKETLLTADRKLAASIPAYWPDVLEKHGCRLVRETNWECTNAACETSYAGVHDRLFRPVLREFHRLSIEFFSGNSVKQIDKRIGANGFSLVCHNAASSGKRLPRFLVCNGVCYDWQAEEPHLHLAVASMFHREIQPLRSIVGSIANVREMVC